MKIKQPMDAYGIFATFRFGSTMAIRNAGFGAKLKVNAH